MSETIDSYTSVQKGDKMIMAVYQYEHQLELTEDNAFIWTKEMINYDSLNREFNNFFQHKIKCSKWYGHYKMSGDTLILSAEIINEDNLYYLSDKNSETYRFLLNPEKDSLKSPVKFNYFFRKKDENRFTDSAYSTNPKYHAHQRMERKRLSPDGKSTGWDALFFNYTLKFEKDNTFLLEKNQNDYSTFIYGNWYRFGNYVLLENIGTQSGKSKTLFEKTYFEKYRIQSDTTLFNEAERLLFTTD